MQREGDLGTLSPKKDVSINPSPLRIQEASQKRRQKECKGVRGGKHQESKATLWNPKMTFPRVFGQVLGIQVT